MQSVVARLLAEHENLGGLVRLLDRQPALMADPDAPNVGLLVDALYYLTRFPDVTHHALEDRIGERLCHKGALEATVAAELGAQHAALARQGHDLLRDLESAARGETMSRELLQANIRLYAERLRHNMAVEELALFPAARLRLDEADWQAIADDFARGPAGQGVGARGIELLRHGLSDPLFGTPAEARFAQLRQAIELQAGGNLLD